MNLQLEKDTVKRKSNHLSYSEETRDFLKLSVSLDKTKAKS